MQVMTGLACYVVVNAGRELGSFHTLSSAKAHAVAMNAPRVEQWRGRNLITVFHWSPRDGGWLIYELAQK